MLFAELAYDYTRKSGKENNQEQFTFIYNNQNIASDSAKSLNELSIHDGSEIEVLISNKSKTSKIS